MKKREESLQQIQSQERSLANATQQKQSFKQKHEEIQIFVKDELDTSLKDESVAHATLASPQGQKSSENQPAQIQSLLIHKITATTLAQHVKSSPGDDNIELEGLIQDVSSSSNKLNLQGGADSLYGLEDRRAMQMEEQTSVKTSMTKIGQVVQSINPQKQTTIACPETQSYGNQSMPPLDAKLDICQSDHKVINADESFTRLIQANQILPVTQELVETPMQGLLNDTLISYPARLEKLNDSNADELSFDPGEGLDFLQQVIARDKIRQTVVTPKDQRQRLQYFENPKIPGHFVSVDYFQLNLKPFSKTCTETPQPILITCKGKHKLVNQDFPDEDQTDQCSHLNDMDQKERSGLKSWCCIEKDCEYKKRICSQCRTDYFVRRKLEQKTANHHFYQTIAIQNDSDDPLAEGKFYDTVEFENTKVTDSETFVMICFWKKEVQKMNCYRKIKIDRPYVLPLPLQYTGIFNKKNLFGQFLAFGLNKEAFYFQYEQNTQNNELSYEIKVKFFYFDEDHKQQSALDPLINQSCQSLIDQFEESMSYYKKNSSEKIKSFIYNNSVEFYEIKAQQTDGTDYVVDYPVLLYSDQSYFEKNVIMANLGIDCPQIKINIEPYKFLNFVKDKNRNFIFYGQKENNYNDIYKFADQGYVAFLVQHEKTTLIGLMICRFYLWRKPGDEDYKPPQIQLVKNDIFEEVKVSKVIEVFIIGKAILVQYFDDNENVQLFAFYKDTQKSQSLRPLNSNEQFSYLKMCGTSKNVFIIAVSNEQTHTLYQIHYDAEVKLQNVWSTSSQIIQMCIQQDTETQNNTFGIYLYNDESEWSLVSFLQNNNHTYFTQIDKIDGFDNMLSLKHPKLCQMVKDEWKKQQTYKILDYFEDQNRNKQGDQNVQDERVLNNLEPLMIPKTCKQIQMVIEGSLSYFRTTNQIQTKIIDLIGDTLNIGSQVNFVKNQIILQTQHQQLFFFDTQTLLLLSRKPKVYDFQILSSNQDDECQYAIDSNGSIIKYSDNQEIIYKKSCLEKFIENIIILQKSLGINQYVHIQPIILLEDKKIQMTTKGKIVTLLSCLQYQSNCTEMTKISDFCACGNCGKLETFIINGISQVNAFCVTPNYLVLMFGFTLKFIPDPEIKNGTTTRINLFQTIVELDKPITNLTQVNKNSLFMFPEIEAHNDFIQFETEWLGDTDTAFIWDLKNNQAVQTLVKPFQFNEVSDFAQTGFKLKINDRVIKNNKNQTYFGQREQLFKIYSDQQISIIQQLLYYKYPSDIMQNLEQRDFIETVFANIEGHTLFSLILSKKNNRVLNLVIERLLNKNINLTEIQIRRLYQNLIKPFIKDNDCKLLQQYHFQNEQVQKYSKKTILEACFDNAYSDDWDYQKNEQKPVIDCIISLFDLCPEKRLSNIVTSIEVLLQKFQNPKSSQLVNFMQNATFVKQGQDSIFTIENVQWDQRYTRIFFGSDTFRLCEAEINQKIEAKQPLSFIGKCFLQQYSRNKAPQDLRVRIIDVKWMKKTSNSLKKLYMYLANTNDSNVYEDELVKILLQIQDYSSQIFLWGFLPYSVYMGNVLYYFTSVIPQTERDNGFFKGSSTNIALRSVILILTIILFAIEIRQSKIYYNFWGIFQSYSYLMNIIIVGIHSSELDIDIDKLIQAASFATFLIWILILYWVRLNSNMSFYVDIVFSSIMDIQYFLLMLVLMILTFSNALYILDYSKINQSQGRVDKYESFIIDVSGNTFMSLFIQQSLLGLGSVPTENIADNKFCALIWFYFLAAVIVTNVAFFNILIAIVSDTYERIMESKERSHLKQQVGITSEFIDLIIFDKEIYMHEYLYIIEPVYDDNQIQDWEGGLKLIKRNLKRQEEKLSFRLDKIQTDFNSQFNTIQKSTDTLKDTLKEEIDSVRTMLAQVLSAVNK